MEHLMASAKVQGHLTKVMEVVMKQGKPSGNYMATMIERVQTAIKQNVPAKDRLAVRMAILKQAKTIAG